MRGGTTATYVLSPKFLMPSFFPCPVPAVAGCKRLGVANRTRATCPGHANRVRDKGVCVSQGMRVPDPAGRGVIAPMPPNQGLFSRLTPAGRGNATAVTKLLPAAPGNRGRTSAALAPSRSLSCPSPARVTTPVRATTDEEVSTVDKYGTVKLGDLALDKRIWPRGEIKLHWVSALLADLVSGRVKPPAVGRKGAMDPLLVDRGTRVIVDGNHRYMALKQFYGEGWREREVVVQWIDLPPFEQDPLAWREVVLRTNRHRGLPLDGREREAQARLILRELDNPYSERAKRLAALLHYTDQGWAEFVQTYLHAVKATPPPLKPRPVEQKGAQQPVLPGDVQKALRQGATTRARLQAAAEALLAALEETAPASLTERDRVLLRRVLAAVRKLVEEAA